MTITLNAVNKVVIVQRRLPHYRVPLFNRLREVLLERRVDLQLLIGQGTSNEKEKNDAGILPWAKLIPTRYFFGDRLCWQSFGRHLLGASLVVVTQENKLLRNHFLMVAPRPYRVAFWGHGANLQARHQNGVRESFKRWTTKRADWWFAYTQLSADLVKASGFPADRVTVLNNAIDTCAMQLQRQSITPEDAQSVRRLLGLENQPIAAFLGSLYPDKRLDFLIAAADAIHNEIPGFQLLILGDGPERGKIQAWCAERPWARWVGARLGRDKALYLSIAQIMLNPGLVGLGILDSFAYGVPIVTTDCRIHSPEIAYLDNGNNGVITPDSMDFYVDACVSLLRDASALSALRSRCIASAQLYTIEDMAIRFADGIEMAIDLRSSV